MDEAVPLGPAKRFTRDISWKKCEESLDAAVSNWRIEHCTFCFAKNLTGSQHRSFHERLVRRHHGVTVDYWAHGNLESKLVASEQGQRIANYFYENETLNTEALMTALEAGGTRAALRRCRVRDAEPPCTLRHAR